ncbi:hypothetical protein WA158_006622 [Blastocystis sp. Blastoise]
MVKEKVEFNANKMDDAQRNVIHFERLFNDLIGILNKSISFCIHSSESINELAKQSIRSCEGMNDMKRSDPHIIIQESSYVPEFDVTMNDNDDGIDYIQFKNGGPLYSLPKRITNSLVGSYLYESAQEDERTVDGSIYLDYPDDETVAPLFIDSLMNKKINVDILKQKDKLALLRMFEYCEVPIPEELMKIYYHRDCYMKEYKADDDIVLYINFKKDKVLRDYLKKNGLWKKIINRYADGYVDYDKENNEMYLNINYKYINHIYEYIQYKCIYISEEETKIINRDLLKKEMYSIFDNQGTQAVDNGWNINISFPHSCILDSRNVYDLESWLGSEKKWKLIFRASEHEYKASEFHKYCDHKCPTVTIIKHIGHDDKINIFGGYTTQYWESRSENFWKYDNGSFLFTLRNEHDIPPTKYDVLKPASALYCDKTSGPCFLDVYISDDCHKNKNKNKKKNKNKNKNKNSYINGKTSVYSYNSTPKCTSLFVNTAGRDESNYFNVDEYEVYELIPNPDLYLPNSILITKEMGIELSKWFDKSKEWELLYRCSDENRSVKKWHEKCDNKESLVIIQGKGEDGQSYIFGGYTSIGWGKNHSDMENPPRKGMGWRGDSKAFLFSLTNPHGYNYAKLDINHKYANYALISNDSNSELTFCYCISLITQIGKDKFINGSNIFLSKENPIYVSPYRKLGNNFFVNTEDHDEKNYFDLIDFEVYTGI